jgi:excisionase family DNA binding protein
MHGPEELGKPEEAADKPFVTVKEACAMMPCGTTKLYDLIGSGQIEAYKLGKRTLLSVPSIKRFQRSLPRAPIGRRAA